ncbi:MAG: CorA family divalent cation transporter, partial [Planctomycetaceae bacterium]
MSRKRHNKRGNRFHRQTAPGAMPGSVIADPASPSPKIHVIAYGSDTFEEIVDARIDTIKSLVGKHRVVWINVEGLGDAKIIEELGKLFDLHALALEDVVHVHQRAKVDSYDDHLFIVSRMVSMREQLETEQLSMFLGPNFVLSFLEDPGDCLDPLRDRLRRKRGQTRAEGPDYLAYA